MRLVTSRLAVRLLLTLCLGIPLSQVQADEEERESDFPSASSSAIAELEKQIAAALPAAALPQEQCIFLHKRGMAHIRLGHYDAALDDFKQALDMKQAASPEKWCDRWRLQGDLHLAMQSTGDWQIVAGYAQAISDEYQAGNQWHYFAAQLWLVDAQIKLAALRKADEAFQRASELLPKLRQQKGWDIYGAHFLGRHSSFAAKMQELRGNHVEAERFRRQALSYAQEFLTTVSGRRSAEHLDIRLAAGTLTERKRHLAGILAVQGKTGEAEILARQALQETQTRSGQNTLVTANALSMLGNIKLQQGLIDEALRLQQSALAALENSGVRSYSTSLANLRMQIGFLLGVQNRWADALKAYEQRDEGLRGNTGQYKNRCQQPHLGNGAA